MIKVVPILFREAIIDNKLYDIEGRILVYFMSSNIFTFAAVITILPYYDIYAI